MPARPTIRLAVLDLAGTTVRDDGAVEAAFVEALRQAGAGPDTDGFSQRLEYLRATMGRSKIEVFRELLGDEPAAQRANEAFEAAYGAGLGAGGAEPIPGAVDAIATLRARGIRVCLTTGFSARTLEALLDARLARSGRLGAQPERPRPRSAPPGSGPGRVARPRDRRRASGRGGG